MTYADTDFFIALLKPKDWLKSRAGKLYREHRGTLWTSLTTVIELLLIADRHGLDPEEIVVEVSEMVTVRDADTKMLLLAAYFMKEHRLHTFDALHAAACSRSGDKILSSDSVFDRVGLQRLRLEDAA